MNEYRITLSKDNRVVYIHVCSDHEEDVDEFANDVYPCWTVSEVECVTNRD